MMYILAPLLLAASIVMAQSPTLAEGPAPSGVGSPNPTATVSLSVSSSQVSSCEPLDITWSVENETAAADAAVLTLFYSTLGVNQVDNSTSQEYNPHSVQNYLAQMQVSQGIFHWNPVWLTDPGFYVITATTDADPSQGDPSIRIRQSQRFLLTVQNRSCLDQAPSTTPTSTPSITDLPALTTNTNSSTPSETVGMTNTSKPSKIGPIVGGTLAGCAALGLLMALLICRRRRQVIAKNVTPRTIAGKAHNRTWGGLSSIDKLQGEIPVVVPAESPYAYRRRSQSTGRAMTVTTEEDGEKVHKDEFPVDADLLAEMPTLAPAKSARRYSSDALSNVLRQKGGVDKHARNMAPALPVLSTTTATSGGGDDPFSDAAFIAHGKRMSALSVPSTARSPSRVSEVGAPSPSPIPPATPVASQPSTIVRNTSANASIGRPSRKPVPQYEDDEFELTKPHKSSPTALQPPSNYSRPGSSRGDLSSSATSHSNALASSVESSSTNWLHAPIANRNIGLAGQNEGSTVHYLIPDMPPPPRN